MAFDSHDPTRLAQFWATVLGREIAEDASGALLAGEGAQLGLRFVRSSAQPVRPNRMHLHLTSTGANDQQQTVTRALELGARHLNFGQRPEDGHVVLGDPEGNEFCVIEPGNAYLDGCGFLGELACDGTREVGLFWSEVLGWPLVWDQDQETAIQSPPGGTKVAWGGPPVALKATRNGQRFELVPAGGRQDAEVDRLISLGATWLEVEEDGAVELADPDGNEFRVTAG